MPQRRCCTCSCDYRGFQASSSFLKASLIQEWDFLNAGEASLSENRASCFALAVAAWCVAIIDPFEPVCDVSFSGRVHYEVIYFPVVFKKVLSFKDTAHDAWVYTSGASAGSTFARNEIPSLVQISLSPFSRSSRLSRVWCTVHCRCAVVVPMLESYLVLG
jgi:hypothetical protein